MDDTPTPANDDTPAPAHRGGLAADPGVSMMITRRQRVALSARGFSEAEIFEMTPAQAHAHLGLAP